MKRTGLTSLAVFAVIVVSAGCSKSDDSKAPASEPPRGAAVGTGGAGANVNGDAEFVPDVASKNMAEIELSRMALEKAISADVRTFAQMMIDDHSAAGSKLKSVVSGQTIAWPTQVDDKHRETADELSKKQGVDFERDYLKAMVHGHEDLAAKLESRLDVQSLADWKTAAAGRSRTTAVPEPNQMGDVQVRPLNSDNDVTAKINQWAADTYPVAQKHLDAARALENAVKKRSTN
jgi:putative membrane protein